MLILFNAITRKHEKIIMNFPNYYITFGLSKTDKNIKYSYLKLHRIGQLPEYTVFVDKYHENPKH